MSASKTAVKPVTLYLTALLSLLIAMVGSTSGFAAFEPKALKVDVNMAPGNDDTPTKPNCSQESDGSMLCSNEFNFSESDFKGNGTVEYLPTGDTGTIKLLCDMSMRISMTVNVVMTGGGGPPSSDNMTLISMNGSGHQNCSWLMTFSDDRHSRLSGTINGVMRMAKTDPTDGCERNCVRQSGRFHVAVVEGSGLFSNTVGTGSFCHDSVMNFMNEGGRGGEEDKSCSSTDATAASVGASADSGNMSLKLKRGKFGVSVASRLTDLESNDSNPLRVATAKGAECKANARGAKQIDLGSAKANSSGTATFKGALAKKLGRGSWKVSVSCKKGSHAAISTKRVKVS